MRKSYLVRGTILTLVSVWALLTTYKLIRRYRMKKTYSISHLGTEPDHYYRMPASKEERRAELGRGTWTFLHTVAAKYPAYPTKEEKTTAIQLMEMIAQIFPCEECRGHFRALVDDFPPTVNTQKEFSLWMCQAHNIVNKRFGKPVFDCNRLDDRWDCGCK